MNYVDYTIEGGNLTFIIPKTQMLVEHEFVIINGTAEYQAFTPNGTIWYYDFIEGGTSSYTPGGEDDDDDDQDDDDDIDDEAEGTKLGPFKTKDGKPIDGGEAIVGPGGTRTVYQAVTDSEGYAAFSEKIPQGNYSLKVQVEGVPVIESELAISSTDDVTYDGNPQPSLSEKTHAEIYDVQDDDDDDDVEPPEEEEEDSPGFEFSLVALGVLCAFLLFRKYRK